MVRAEERCTSYESKRSVFERVIPGDKLVILSELRDKAPCPEVEP